MFEGRAERSDIQTFCDRVIESVQEPISANGVVCTIGASVGFVISDVASCSVESLVSNADYALYEAKRGGRGIAQEFTPRLRKQIDDQRSLTAEILNALQQDCVTCVLQPQICAETGTLLGVESLGRIKAANGRLMVPADFIPELEKMERMEEFDLQVARKSLDAFLEIQKLGSDIPSVSINASGGALRSTE